MRRAGLKSRVDEANDLIAQERYAEAVVLLERLHKERPDDVIVLINLGLQHIDIIRSGEEPYKVARDEIQTMNVDEQVRWLAANPRVLQRPIVVAGDQARIGRPPESVLEILP